MFDTSFLHYATVGLVVGCNSVAVGIGEGLTSLAALKAFIIQPSAREEITRTLMLSMALIETSAVIGLTIGFMFLTPPADNPHVFLMHYSVTGIGLAICLTGFVLGIAASFPAQAACLAVARQPFFNQKIQMLMLLTQSLMQTPLLFAFIISFFIKEQIPHVTSLAGSMRLIAAGLCIGLGSIGPTIGLAHFARQACKSLGVNRYAYKEILSFTLISEALIESPIIFSLVMSFALLGTNPSAMSLATGGIPFIAAAIVMGLGTLGVGIGSGYTATKSCKYLAINPESYSQLSRTSLTAQVLIETCSIYAFLIALFVLLLQ
ncbi:MAG: F-type H+-transporting ATPase subunit c [Alteromonas naphthalenivorans]|jgi:F-type H+-transporting ATPase subunit c